MAYWDEVFKKEKIIWKNPDKSIIDLVPLLRKRKLKRILDLGCGAGRHIVYLCKRGFFVIGLDISSAALNLAQKWLEKEKIDNYCLVEGDMRKLQFPDEHFDVVISIGTIHHDVMEKLKRTVSEIRRVSKVKGLVFVTLVSKKDCKFGIGKKLETNTYQNGKVVHHFFDEDGIKKLFSKFRIMKIKERAEVIPRKLLIHSNILKKIKKKKVQSVHWQILAEKS